MDFLGERRNIISKSYFGLCSCPELKNKKNPMFFLEEKTTFLEKDSVSGYDIKINLQLAHSSTHRHCTGFQVWSLWNFPLRFQSWGNQEQWPAFRGTDSISVEARLSVEMLHFDKLAGLSSFPPVLYV